MIVNLGLRGKSAPQKGPNLRNRYLAAFVLLAVLATVWLCFRRYPGSVAPFVLFNASYLALALSVIPKPRAYGYTFLALFLSLGFWLKFTAHTILGHRYVEPIGAFDGSAASWDLALTASSAAALGVLVARLAHVLIARRLAGDDPAPSTEGVRVPAWYAERKVLVWAGTFLAILALNAANAEAAFYQIGVNPEVVLPLKLNVFAAWLLNVGFALWVAVLVWWETSLKPGGLKYLLLAPLAEGMVATTSILSRSVYLFHALPYAFAIAEPGTRLRRLLSRRAVLVLSCLFAVAFFVGLVGVSVLRVYTYPGPLNPNNPPSAAKPQPARTEPAPVVRSKPAPASQPKSPSVAQPRQNEPVALSQEQKDAAYAVMTRQIMTMFVDRWIGLEGVLAVSGREGELGRGLFLAGMGDDPRLGEASLYQRISGSRYVEQDDFTFMTLAGATALLFLSGSFLVVAAGMATVALVLISIEVVFYRLVGNPFLASVSGLALANVVCQMNFPYLTAVFFAQMVVGLTFLWALQVASPKISARPNT